MYLLVRKSLLGSSGQAMASARTPTRKISSNSFRFRSVSILCFAFVVAVAFAWTWTLFCILRHEHEQEKEQPQRASQWTKVKPKPNKASFHIVFSTGCSAFQDWQSYAFFYQIQQTLENASASALAMQMTLDNTNVTRIASGCTAQQELTLRDIFNKQWGNHNTNFHLHFTPDYSRILPNEKYHFFNKPHGLKHWFDHGLLFDHPKTSFQRQRKLEETIFILLDPDQLMLRPFMQDYSQDRFVVWSEPDQIIHKAVEHGKPMAQLYMFGTSWRKKINMTEILLTSGLATPQTVSSMPSGVWNWTNKEVFHYYRPGPPYIATGRDMFQIATAWSQFVLPVYRQTKDHLSEMFAYSVAAAHLQLRHQLVKSLMVSNADVDEEGWPLIDALDASRVCDTTVSQQRLPEVLHYCQGYALEEFFFSKYSLPKEFLSCNHALLKVPPPFDNKKPAPFYTEEVGSGTWPGGKTRNFTKIKRQRHAFMTCQMLHRLNQAATVYKKRHCSMNTGNYDYLGGDKETVTANFDETFIWPHLQNSSKSPATVSVR